MGLTPKRESKSYRVPCVNENGEEVFTCGAQYSENGIFVSFEMLNATYCAEHKTEVQEAISNFLPHLNALLIEDNLPIIHDPTVR
ncbi:MAG: hypothetical protein IKH75_01110 [Ruminococcus sp.]|nr:hypothetical protein [Ruminococcus sp.]